MKSHKAPWGRMLIVSSIIVAVLCVGSSALTLVFLRDLKSTHLTWTAWLPLVILIGCLPFVVRSYTITDDAIWIRRLFWSTRLERLGLRSATVVPEAMKGSIRTCGNGGCFSITGWYWSRKLGFYRAYVTDLKHTVVLEFSMRKIVLSPEDPEAFVRELGFTVSPDGAA